MPTSNPRITVTLEPESAAVLRRVSTLTKQSQSALISDVINQARPVFERLAKILEVAQKAKDDLRAEQVERLEAQQAAVERQLGLMLDDLDDSTRPLLEYAEKVRRRAAPATASVRTPARAARGAESPPMSNRGVRSPGKVKTKRVRGTTRAVRRGG